jgi:signal transduction histidine kinase
VRRQLLATYLALALAVLAALEIPLGITYARNQKTDLENRIRLDALTIATLAEDGLERQVARPTRALMSTAAAYAKSPGGRVVVVDGTGISLLDTGSRTLRRFASRPEIASALAGETASGTRHSSTLGTDLMYVAVPVASSGTVHGAVRVTYPTSALDRRVRRYWLVLAAIAAVVLAVAAVVGLRLSRTVTAPLANLEEAAKAAGEGDLTARAAVDAGPPEIRALAARFNEMVARLEVLVRSQQEFVADASHQLRTPLTALQLRLENLGRDVGPGGAAQLDGALAEVTRLGGLVDGLLSLARADAIEASPVSVDLHDAVRSRFAAWAARAERTEVTLELDVPTGLRAEATPGSLDQVLDNLVANAMAVSPRGSRISVRGLRAERFVELHVTDEGPGLTADQRARAFDRFWRESPSSGTGLGLAIAHQLVTADGGELELRDAAGSGGLDAVVRLPAS